uniref:Telo_bind domain-containing protein n=1 Tax=Strongyloides papillosus TaxID=174720 RepID=A0A0N5BJP8_STREA
MSNNDSEFVDFLQNAIEKSDQTVNNNLLLIEIGKNTNNGFEATDGYSKLLRTKFKRISVTFLEEVQKYKRVYIRVKEIKIHTRYDFSLNEFHKDLEVIDYDVVKDKTFSLINKELKVVNTKIDIGPINEPYRPEAGEKKLEDVYNMGENVSCWVNVLVVLKISPDDNIQDNSENHSLNILVADYRNCTMNCAAFKINSNNNFCKDIEVGKFYKMKLSNAKLLNSTKSCTRHFVTIKKGIHLTQTTVSFEPSTNKFNYQAPYSFLEYMNVIPKLSNNNPINVVGIVARIDEITTVSSDSMKTPTSRRIIYLTDGEIIIPIYVYGELAHFNFETKQLIGVRYGNVKKHVVCGNVIICNRLSRMDNVDTCDYMDIFSKISTINFEELKYPDLTTLPTVGEVVHNKGKFLLHIRDTQKRKVQPYKFYTIGKITSFTNFVKPDKKKKNQQENQEKDTTDEPYTRININDSIVSIPDVTVFVNKMSNIAPGLAEDIEKLIANNINMNEYLEKLKNIPMVFKIRLDNHKYLANNGQILYLPNKLCEFVDFCPSEEYSDWIERIRKDIKDLVNLNL